MLPEVEFSRLLPGFSSPEATAERRMFSAGRSFIEPPGLNHSALAKTCTCEGRSEATRRRGSRGVLPTWAARPALVGVESCSLGNVIKSDLMTPVTVNEKTTDDKQKRAALTQRKALCETGCASGVATMQEAGCRSAVRIFSDRVSVTRRQLRAPPRTHASRHSSDLQYG